MNEIVLGGVSVLELSAKCKSKKELYNFLTQDCKAFLPKFDATNIYFFKQIMRAQKDYIKRDAVKVSAVPQIEGLTVQDFLDYAKSNPIALRYLPDERDWVHLDRQWICDLLYTLDTEGVTNLIQTAMTVRKEKLEQNRDLIIKMRPEFVDALQRCLNFSTERGRTANLMKESSSRKRTVDEMEDVKEEEQALKRNKQEFLQQAKQLRIERQNLEQQISRLLDDRDQQMSALSSQNLGQPHMDF